MSPDQGTLDVFEGGRRENLKIKLNKLHLHFTDSPNFCKSREAQLLEEYYIQGVLRVCL